MVSRQLDDLRKKGRLSEGVKTEKNGTIKIELDQEQVLPSHFRLRESDNRILNTAYYYKETLKKHVIIVSKDTNLRLKAEAVDIEAQDYETGKVNLSELYAGYQEMDVTSAQIDAFYKSKELELTGKFYPNEFVILKASDNPKKSAMVLPQKLCIRFITIEMFN